MSEHLLYLNIGSNLKPEYHLPRAVDLLRSFGRVEAVSNAWESRPVGAEGPNFLNVCLLISAGLTADEFKTTVIRRIESTLGRVRSSDPNAPRTIDIDIVMADGKPARLETWSNAFVVVPISELAPALAHPLTGEKLAEAAARLQAETWIAPRPDVIRRSGTAGARS